MFETPKRSMIVWFLDTSKQVIGSSTQHFLNLFISDKIGAHAGVQCEWFLISLVLDSTIGTLLCYLIQMFLTYLLKNTKHEFKSGEYTKYQEQTSQDETPVIDFKLFFLQVFYWILIVIIVKILFLFKIKNSRKF